MKEIDGQTAIPILKTIARTRLDPSAGERIPQQETVEALRGHFRHEDQPPPTEGELAQVALEMLSEDPTYAEPINILASQSASKAPEKYIEPGTIALTIAVLLALQTRIKLKASGTRKMVDRSGKESSKRHCCQTRRAASPGVSG